MPNLPMPQHLLRRTTTTPLVISLVVLFLLGPPPGSAFAQEDATETENSEQTVLQESTSADGVSDDLSGRSVKTGDVKVGGGEAIAGDAYAGNGCARAGDVTAGNCDEKDSGFQSDGPGNGSPDGAPDDEGRAEEDGTTAPQSTSEETTLQDTISEDTTLEETTLPEETTGGETTSSPSPAQGERSLCPAAPPKDVVEAEIEGAADGDTLTLAKPVQGYDTVRLIGVDTPELEGEDGRPESFAEEASDFTAEELEGREVLLQVGEEEADRYGRLLAHAWTAPEDGLVGGLKRMVGMGEAELFNLKLLEEGYAEVLTIEPNDLYAECFEAAEAEARDADDGIWAEDEGTGGSADDQYDEEIAPETTAQASPPPEPETGPMENTPTEQPPAETPPTEEPSALPEEEPAAEELERRRPAAEDQYEQTPAPESERQDPEVQDRETLEPEVRESIAPSGGDEAAVLETEASPATSVEAGASPEPAGTLPVRTASAAPVSVLPDTGGPSLLAAGAGLAAAVLLGGAMLGFLALWSVLRRDLPGGR